MEAKASALSRLTQVIVRGRILIGETVTSRMKANSAQAITRA